MSTATATKIPGVRISKRPSDLPSAGLFELPPDFDSKRFASQYVKKGNDVEKAKQEQPIVGTSYTSDGWEVWKRADASYHQVTVSDGTYILMCRAIAIQKEVNRIYGDLSRERMTRERRGETIAGQSPNDPGMISEEKLSKVIGDEGSEREEDVRVFGAQN